MSGLTTRRDLDRLKRALPRGPFHTRILYNSPQPPFDGLPKSMGWDSWQVLECWWELQRRRELRLMSGDSHGRNTARVE